MVSDIQKIQKTDKIKAVLTDLDNTMWKGTLAEKEVLELNEKYYRFLKTVYEKGIQLIVVSRNDKPDVEKAFERLNIDSEIFTAVIANWEPKYLNVDKIIQQMNLRPETVVFIDDNPMELSEVKKKVKGINCIDANEWQSLKGVSYIHEKRKESAGQIQTRINRYRTAIEAENAKKNFEEDREFLKSLKRELSIGEISYDNLDRFANLLAITHRINFNPGKFEDYDHAMDYIHKRINKGYKPYAISTKENDTMLGLTGALLVRISQEEAMIEDGTFSCGIIGRDFEQKSILKLMEMLQKQSIRRLKAQITNTSSNQRVRQIFEELGFDISEKTKGKTVYEADLTTFTPEKEYEWIQAVQGEPDMNYYGIPSVIDFFENKVKTVIEPESSILNVGAARGEVLGHLHENIRKEFYEYMEGMNVEYKKLDMQYIEEEDNAVGNAENLKPIIKSESQDVVMAIELLEHTQHFWKAINEIIRVTKVGGRIFISVPSFHYPKHEYPIDKWRIGPSTLKSFFDREEFEIEQFSTEGDNTTPRRCMILAKKTKPTNIEYEMPKHGNVDWNSGLTIFE